MATKIKLPCIITSRLMPGIRIGELEISIRYSSREGSEPGRVRYEYFLDHRDWSYSSDDLQSGCYVHSLQSGLESLLAFLGACGEAWNYGNRTGNESENADLFPQHVALWCADNEDEFAMLGFEIDERDWVIQEECEA